MGEYRRTPSLPIAIRRMKTYDSQNSILAQRIFMDEHSFKNKLEDHMKFLAQELRALRTSRASIELVEDIAVEAYGSSLPIKQVASISAPETRTILIQPWDKALIPAIEKGLRQSELQINPIVDGSDVRIVFPPLTEERRKELVKFAHKKLEEVRMQIRKTREEAMNEIDANEERGEISEDEKFRQRASFQKIIEEYNQRVQEVGDKKENEILEI